MSKFHEAVEEADGPATADRNSRARRPCVNWLLEAGMIKHSDQEIDAQMLGLYLGHCLDKDLSFHSLKSTRTAVNKANLATYGRLPMPVGIYTPWLIARCIAGAARKQGENPPPDRYALSRRWLRILVQSALDNDDPEFAVMAAVAFYFCHRGGEIGGPIHGEKTAKEQGHALRVQDVHVTDGTKGRAFHVHLKSSKTSATPHQPQRMPEMKGDVSCPVARYEAYVARVAQRTTAAAARGKPRPDRTQHAFVNKAGHPWSVRSISAALVKYAKKTGLDTEVYPLPISSHSFRAGGATWLACARRVSLEVLRLWGRWTENSKEVIAYIRLAKWCSADTADL
jgi:hypothetical protein